MERIKQERAEGKPYYDANVGRRILHPKYY
jgi:hypothetical protein